MGHLAGLARTTAVPDTFILMGGDLCHHGGELRPSAHLPIPSEVSFPVPDEDVLRSRMARCPGGGMGGALFEQLNAARGRGPDEPFFDPKIASDLGRAVETIRRTQEADARDDVLCVFAHDYTIAGVVDLFPLPANEWKRKGWREQVLWRFLGDLALPAVLASDAQGG